MKRLPDAKQHLGEKEAEEVFGWILDGETSDEDVARFLIDMSARSETAEEIAGAARALARWGLGRHGWALPGPGAGLGQGACGAHL